MRNSRQIYALLLAVALFALSDLSFAKGSKGSRPYYGGGSHSASHGGHYMGGGGSSHQGGKYANPRTGNRYGRHK